MEDAELFTEDQLLLHLRALDSVEARQAAAEWMAYHKANAKEIVKIWKTELLGAAVERVPQILFVGGDVIQLTSATDPSFAACIGRVLPTLVQTLLNQAVRLTPAQLRTLHTCVMDLISTLATNPHIPPEWITGIRRALNHAVEKADYGWIYDGLRSTDDAWNSLERTSAEAESLKQQLMVMHNKLRYREISGTPQELELMDERAGKYLKQTDRFTKDLATLRGDLDTKVLAHADELLAEITQRHSELMEAKKRGRQEDVAPQPEAKRPKVAQGTPTSTPKSPPTSIVVNATGDSDESDDSDFDDDSSDDGPKITIE